MSSGQAPGAPRGGRILDMGCGTGSLALHLELLEADARALRFADGSFDLVTLAAVLHGPADEGRLALLREARRLSRGIVLVHDNPPFPGPRGGFAPLLRLPERMEGSDFDSFLRRGRLEMAAVFPSATVLPVAADSAWYICRQAAQAGGAG